MIINTKNLNYPLSFVLIPFLLILFHSNSKAQVRNRTVEAFCTSSYIAGIGWEEWSEWSYSESVSDNIKFKIAPDQGGIVVDLTGDYERFRFKLFSPELLEIDSDHKRVYEGSYELIPSDVSLSESTGKYTLKIPDGDYNDLFEGHADTCAIWLHTDGDSFAIKMKVR